MKKTIQALFLTASTEVMLFFLSSTALGLSILGTDCRKTDKEKEDTFSANIQEGALYLDFHCTLTPLDIKQ